MHLFKAFAHSKFQMISCFDDFIFPTPVELSSRIKNDGHGGLATKTFGLAIRSSLLHLSRRHLVFIFQPFSSSAATPVLRPSCIERSLKRAGEFTSVKSTAHLSKQVFTSPCTDSLGLPGNAFDVNTRLVNFSKSGALL